MERTKLGGERRLRMRSQKLQYIGSCLLSVLVGAILAGAKIMDQALPLAACFVAAIPLGIRSLTGTLGALLGYLLRCDGAEAVEFSALTLLLLCALALFHGTGLTARSWFMPVMAAVISAVLGSVRLMGTVEVTWSLWLTKTLLAGLCTDGFRRAVRGNDRARSLLLGGLVLGLAAEGSLPELGLLLAVAVSVAGRDLPTAVIMGMAVDLSGVTAPCVTAALALPEIFCKALCVRRSETRGMSYLVIPMAVLLFFGELSVMGVVAIPLGAVLGYLFGRFCPHRVGTEGENGDGSRLEEAAQVLELLGGELPEEGPVISQREAERVFDGAAEQVCRSCAFFHRCWQNRAAQTYRELAAAAEKIMERGVAKEEDFSSRFRDRCCRAEELREAIDRELEAMLLRRQYRMRMQEGRRVLSEEYACVAGYLRAVGRGRTPKPERRFVPSVSVCSANKGGARVSGDRGACFMGRGADYYVLLCDGMGTGAEASKLSGQAVRLLERLLKSGMDPEGALRLFNGNMLLRGTGAFSTVDLLQLDLCTGAATLYKWGGAPSYWRDGEQVRKIGTATPPPGLGVGEHPLPERYTLSLKGGELLVLISDGAYGEETETAIAAYGNGSPRELAAMLIAGMDAEDDMTAIVVSLRHRAS